MFKAITNASIFITDAATSVTDVINETVSGAVQSGQYATGRRVSGVKFDTAAVGKAMVKCHDFMHNALYGGGYMDTISYSNMEALEKATAPTV